MTTMRSRKQGVAHRHDHRLQFYENADRAQFVHVADSKPRSYVLPLRAAQSCGKKHCPGLRGFEEGFGMAGGGMGIYLFCPKCERVVAKDDEAQEVYFTEPGQPLIRPVCNTCKRALDQKNDPYSTDCGGDCVMCMADAGDPDCEAAVAGLAAKGIGDPVSGYGFP